MEEISGLGLETPYINRRTGSKNRESRIKRFPSKSPHIGSIFERPTMPHELSLIWEKNDMVDLIFSSHLNPF